MLAGKKVSNFQKSCVNVARKLQSAEEELANVAISALCVQVFHASFSLQFYDSFFCNQKLPLAKMSIKAMLQQLSFLPKVYNLPSLRAIKYIKD